MSKSGPIRQKLGPSLKRMRVSIENLENFFKEEHSDENMRKIRNESILLKNALNYCEEFDSIWIQYIDKLQTRENIEAEQKIYDEFKSDNTHFVEWIDKARETILHAKIYLTDDTIDDNNQVQINDNETNNEREDNRTINMEQIRLPTLRLPNFNGDPIYWRTFWQSFEPTVHNQKIPNIQKMTYLLGCLQGEALRAVAGFPISNENYPLIVKLLETRYGNTDALTEALQVELMNLAPANDSLASLRSTSESVERICRQLEDLGVKDENPFVATHIKQKFPRYVITEVLKEEQVGGSKFSTKQIRECIQRIITLKEKVRQCMNPGKPESQIINNMKRNERPPERRFNKFEKEQSRSFTVMTNTKQTEKKFNCLFCGLEHASSKCLKFPSREDRLKRLIQLKRCFLCVKEGHTANNCPSGFACRKCTGRHHILICNQTTNQVLKGPNNSPQIRYTPINGTKSTSNKIIQKKSEQKPVKPKTSASIIESEEKISDAKIEQTSSHLSIQSTNNGTSRSAETILMARKVQVLSPNNPKKLIEILVFFDSGSQTSYITSDLVKRLSPPKVGERILEVNSFRSETPTRFRSAKYLVDVLLTDGKSERIVLSVTDKITKGFQSVKINAVDHNEAISELQHSIELTKEEPDILIGVADFWGFFLKKHQIAPQFYLIETTVGPIVCGKTEMEDDSDTERTNSFSILTEEYYPLKTENIDINKFWDLESIGIKDDPEEDDDETAMNLFEKSIEQIEGRYRVSWPWKSENPELPSNFNMAYSCLNSVVNKLKNNPELMQKYNNYFKEQLEKDIIEKAERKDKTSSDQPSSPLEHFLPHHPVSSKGGTKLRIVLNASARKKYSKSLNDCLYRGPVMLPDLAGLLIRLYQKCTPRRSGKGIPCN